MRPTLALIPFLALLLAACGAAAPAQPASAPGDSAQPVEAPASPVVTTAPAEVPSDDPGAGNADPTPGGADVTGIDACALITQAEAEAALGVTLRPPFSGGTPDVNIRSCLHASKDGNGPQVGVTVSGAPDAFRAAEAATVPGVGDEAWWWLDPSRGLLLEAQAGDRFVAFEFNDFRTAAKSTEAALDVLVPLMQTALSRLP